MVLKMILYSGPKIAQNLLTTYHKTYQHSLWFFKKRNLHLTDKRWKLPPWMVFQGIFYRTGSQFQESSPHTLNSSNIIGVKYVAFQGDFIPIGYRIPGLILRIKISSSFHHLLPVCAQADGYVGRLFTLKLSGRALPRLGTSFCICTFV